MPRERSRKRRTLPKSERRRRTSNTRTDPRKQRYSAEDYSHAVDRHNLILDAVNRALKAGFTNPQIALRELEDCRGVDVIMAKEHLRHGLIVKSNVRSQLSRLVRQIERKDAFSPGESKALVAEVNIMKQSLQTNLNRFKSRASKSRPLAA